MIITALFPGSFDPVHYGHLDIAVRASKLFDRLVVGVYASPDKRTVLFTQSERIEMFSRAVANYPNIEVVGYDGLTVQFAKKIGASVMVRGLRVFINKIKNFGVFDDYVRSADLQYFREIGRAHV